MPITNLVFGILFGLMLFNLFIHIQVALRSKWHRTEKAFSVVIFTGFIYIILTFIEYKTASVELYLILSKIQYLSIVLFFLSLFLFTHSYLDEKPYRFIYILAGLFFIFTFIRFFLPYSGIYSEIESMVLVELKWGDRIYMLSGTGSIFLYIYSVLFLFIPVVYLLVIVFRNIKTGNRRKSLFLLAAILSVIGGATYDLIIVSAGIKNLFLTEASFALMLLILNLGLTDQLIVLSKTKAQLMKSLEEKEILLKEIHHRVKNNLSVLISLINLQKEKSGSNETQGHLITTINRLYSIARVHQMLYSSGNFTRIDLKEYLEEISSQIQMSFNRPDVRITVKSKSRKTDLNIIKAIPLGLVINEIITNSFKHAFTNQEKGEISIVLKKNNENIDLTIADSGEGFSEKNNEYDNGLGHQLIELLSKQIGAELKLNPLAGAEYNIILPLKEELTPGDS